MGGWKENEDGANGENEGWELGVRRRGKRASAQRLGVCSASPGSKVKMRVLRAELGLVVLTQVKLRRRAAGVQSG